MVYQAYHALIMGAMLWHPWLLMQFRLMLAFRPSIALLTLCKKGHKSAGARHLWAPKGLLMHMMSLATRFGIWIFTLTLLVASRILVTAGAATVYCAVCCWSWAWASSHALLEMSSGFRCGSLDLTSCSISTTLPEKLYTQLATSPPQPATLYYLN